MAGIGGGRKRSPVGFLDVYYREKEADAFRNANSEIEIFPSDDFYFGRSPSW